MDLVKLLREQAAEIAAEGYAGWGNTMLEAAREIETLQQQAAQPAVELIDIGDGCKAHPAILAAILPDDD